jgi:MFS transporter, PHS family, inorganic phosphate transporter
MMATVFFMQPLGQLSGNLVSLIVVVICKRQGDVDLIRTVDIMWRWVIGIGVVPGVVALLFRLAIPETPRFIIDIEDDPIKAEFDATNLWGESSTSSELEDGVPGATVHISSPSEVSRSVDEDTVITPTNHWTNTDNPPTTLNSKWTLSKADILQYFWHEGNWRTLAGTSLTWLLLDFGFYGIGLSSPQFLAKTWGSLNISGPTPPWKTDDSPDASIYDMLFNTSIHAMIILNLGSVLGGLLMILFASRLNRVSLQKYGFLALAALFIALGTMFITVHKEGAIAIALYIIGQLIFNFGLFSTTSPALETSLEPANCRPFHYCFFRIISHMDGILTSNLILGPNTTTYIIPAEVFPTRYRASCHGISAAAGKLGSILVQIFSAYYKFGSSSPGDQQTRRYGIILIVFSGTMIAGAVVTHFWVPEVQEKRDKNKHGRFGRAGKSKTLEVLATGRSGPRSLPVTSSRRRSLKVGGVGLGWT